MKATKKSTITVEMDIVDARLIVDLLQVVSHGERQVLESVGGSEDENLEILKRFLEATRVLV